MKVINRKYYNLTIMGHNGKVFQKLFLSLLEVNPRLPRTFWFEDVENGCWLHQNDKTILNIEYITRQ